MCLVQGSRKRLQIFLGLQMDCAYGASSVALIIFKIDNSLSRLSNTFILPLIPEPRHLSLGVVACRLLAFDSCVVKVNFAL